MNVCAHANAFVKIVSRNETHRAILLTLLVGPSPINNHASSSKNPASIEVYKWIESASKREYNLKCGLRGGDDCDSNHGDGVMNAGSKISPTNAHRECFPHLKR